MTLQCYQVSTQVSKPLNLISVSTCGQTTYIQTDTDIDLTQDQIIHLTGTAAGDFTDNVVLVWCNDTPASHFSNNSSLNIVVCD